MKSTATKRTFIDAFRSAGRENQFSYQALESLFDYFEEYEAGTGEEIELDVIAICCEYQESSIEDIKSDYSLDAELDEDEVIEWLSEHTQYIGVGDDGLVFASF